MFARARWVLNALLVLLFSVSVAGAQQNAQGPGRPLFAQHELDQMLAPIALYPDSLLSQILMASTYPREVVEAARWSRRNPGLNGDRAVRAVGEADWDPSVKSLVAFPQILDMMDEKMNWTEDLGDAFLDQEAQVMDTVQYLRRKAHAAGNLSSSDQFRVDFEDSSFTINFANPEVAYLPYYNPTIVFGAWWWPAYQPVYWAPWPGYYSRAGYARGYAWGPGIPVARGFFFGAPDWRNRHVKIVNVNNYYYRPAHVNRPADVTRNAGPGAAHVWQHDTAHRRDAPYREASSRQPGARAGAASESRRDVREHDAPAANGRGASANVPAPAATAQPETRGAQVQSGTPARAENAARTPETRGPAAREHERPAFEGRGEPSHRPEARVEPVNRPAQRDNSQPMVASTNARPVPAPTPAVARDPTPRSAPAPANVQSAANHPAAEQRPAAATAASRAEARPAGGRDRANNSATESADGRNSRHP
jgi:hypothetical protein